MDFAGAVISGLIATFVFTITTRLTTLNQMGMERYFSTMFTRNRHAVLGLALLFVAGCVIALVYAALWSVDIGWPSYLYGLIFGVAQWLVVGLALAALPRVHAGVRAGTERPPGPFMVNILGKWAFLAGLANHVIFGLCIAYFYQFFRGRYG
ncbi:MAG: hypothetical protein A4E57_00596 [Syntrophorhabdaceae bacterium PtaU1.Bin034]|nr:MAG: hypothetical protein A4E57_00596 [Syntrophorhabdaceae bacterium PtaU1.Bin034]